jgi:hypothetical protein
MSSSHSIGSVNAQMDSIVGEVIPINQDDFATTNERKHKMEKKKGEKDTMSNHNRSLFHDDA